MLDVLDRRGLHGLLDRPGLVPDEPRGLPAGLFSPVEALGDALEARLRSLPGAKIVVSVEK